VRPRRRVAAGVNQQESESVRKKTATSAKPASIPTASPPKTAGASSPGEQDRAGQRVSVDAIRLRAYQKWEAAGKPDGDAARFWLEAERELSPGE
jgi:hypothetical protein